ncbi:MAG TPA: alpha/beta hydrolase-fold protein [Thermoanaerobaculia bacterium]|nr:alpha/beta hydrolase-fold protein [Thermoanaerobaculia bacterium]
MDLLYTAHVPAGDGPFPTVLAIHGWGASAHDLLGLAPLLHGGQALVLCPEGQVAVPIGGGVVGRGWFPLALGARTDPEAFRHGAEALRRFLDAAMERYPIDPERLVAAGFSQGGTMAYDLVLREPGRFAGLAALSSWFPAELAAGIEKRPEHEGLPVLVTHGTRDQLLEVERGRASREALRPYGVALTYREFDMGHEINPEALRLVVRWLDEKVFAAPRGRAAASKD